MAKRLKWGSIEYLNVLIDQYFETEAIPNIAGLCLKLDISRDCWQYYLTERWRTHRRSEEEIEEMKKIEDETDRASNGAYEEWLEISARPFLVDEFNQEDRRENDAIKAQVSAAIKKAAMRIDNFVVNTMFTSRNPAGAIFYAKAALGYRETAPEQSDQPKLQAGTINIMIMPQPEKPQQLQPVEIIEIEPSNK